MKQYQLVEQGASTLQGANVADAENDAKLLWLHVSGQDSMEYLMNKTADVPNDKEDAYHQAIARRTNHTPLQYITGTQNFMGFDFDVAPNVLIPRFDTEVLVDEVNKHIEKHLKDKETIHILDMCTGSGCIGICLGLMNEKAQVTLADISDDAVNLATRNIAKLAAANCTITKSDLFANICDKYDIIVSNPPYIESDVIGTLMPEVKDHEPHLALDGDADGLKFYKAITQAAPKHLQKNGYIFYEIGHNQAEAVAGILEKENFTGIHTVKDLNKCDRVIYGGLTCLTN